MTSLSLLASGEPKYGQFFSPEKIQRARDEIKNQRDATEQENAMKMEKKLQSQLAREAKKSEYRQQVEKRKEERRVKKAYREDQILARRHIHITERLRRLEAKSQKDIQSTQKLLKSTNTDVIDGGEALQDMTEAVEQISRSGRRVKKPERFQE